MNYVLMPSLEHIALVKIAVTLWNQREIRDHITEDNPVTESGIRILGSHKSKEWPQKEEKVIEMMSQIHVPDLLKAKLLSVIHPIGSQILRWVNYHNENPYFGINVPSEFCWTPQGTIDKRKTAEVCVKDERVKVIGRYHLACNYCLENDIVVLWNKIHEDRKKYYYSEEDPTKAFQEVLILCCTYDMKGEMSKLDSWVESRFERRCSPYRCAVEYAAGSGNKAAVEYFLQKLNHGEREECLVSAAGIVAKIRFHYRAKHTFFPPNHYIEVLCFLLSQMDEERQTEVYKKNPFEVLCCFLDWPWQSFFIETASRMCNFLSGEDYYRVLRTIIDIVKDGYKDYNYRKLFGDFWKQSPNTHKKYCIRTCALDSTFLTEMFMIEDKENVRLILESATIEEKESILFGDAGMDICKCLLSSNDLDLLKFFAQECISSKKAMFKLKLMVKAYVRYHSQEISDEEKDMLNNFVLFLDEQIL